MKWLGQYIQSFVARFRSDVYLESISSGTIASGGNLGLDSNNKVVKATVSGSSGISFDGSTADGVLTYKDADEATVESYLTFANATNVSRLSLLSNQDTGDLFSISVTTHGATTITTTDDDAHAANLLFTLDGDFTVDNDGFGLTKFVTDGFEIENASTSGTAALTIDNDDIDQIALDVDASNTTANIIDINAQALTTGDAIFIDANALTTGSAINIDVDDVVTTTATKSLIQLDYLKPETGASQISTTTGLDINFNGGAGVHGSSTVNMTGVDVALDVINNTGTVVQTGYSATLTDGDVATTVGYFSNVEDGGIDFKAVSSADTGDMFTISTTTHGATTLTTTDDDSQNANFEIAADGNITLDAYNAITLEHQDADKLNFNIGNTNYGFLYAESGNNSQFSLYEAGGDSTEDYFLIDVLENGETQINTVDAAGTAANLSFAVDGTFSVASTGIDIATNGTITNATWSGTAIATNQQKHLAYFEFKGYGTGDGTNYEMPEIMTDANAPFEHDTSTGSDGLTAQTIQTVMRSGGVVMPHTGVLKKFQGWATSAGSGTVNIALFKFTPTDDSAGNLTPVRLVNEQITASGNAIMNSFSETSSFDAGFTAGDIIYPAVLGISTKAFYYNSILEVEWS